MQTSSWKMRLWQFIEHMKIQCCVLLPSLRLEVEIGHMTVDAAVSETYLWLC